MKNRAAILLLAIVLAGCGPWLVYPHLDWLIPWYVSDYISLDSDQKNMLEKRLLKLLAQLNQLLTEKQRSYLLDRIESLAADFDTLSCDPETLPKPSS